MSYNFEEGEKMGGGEQYEIWDYEEGDKIEGRYMRTQHHIPPNDQNMHTIEKDGGECLNIWGNTVLDGELNKLVPKRNAVSIIYDGLKQGKNGKNYKAFTIQVVPTDIEGKAEEGHANYKPKKKEDATTTTEED